MLLLFFFVKSSVMPQGILSLWGRRGIIQPVKVKANAKFVNENLKNDLNIHIWIVYSVTQELTSKEVHLKIEMSGPPEFSDHPTFKQEFLGRASLNKNSVGSGLNDLNLDLRTTFYCWLLTNEHKRYRWFWQCQISDTIKDKWKRAPRVTS